MADAKTKDARAMEMSALAISGGSGSKREPSAPSEGTNKTFELDETAGRGRAVGGEEGVAAGGEVEVEGGGCESMVPAWRMSLLSLSCVAAMS